MVQCNWIDEIVLKQSINEVELLKVKGLGKAKIKEFGSDIIQIINS